ncbi:MAG: Transcriptional regulator, DeoR family, partial [uncultured Nocardioidaceae bacterium]
AGFAAPRADPGRARPARQRAGQRARPDPRGVRHDRAPRPRRAAGGGRAAQGARRRDPWRGPGHRRAGVRRQVRPPAVGEGGDRDPRGDAGRARLRGRDLGRDDDPCAGAPPGDRLRTHRRHQLGLGRGQHARRCPPGRHRAADRRAADPVGRAGRPDRDQHVALAARRRAVHRGARDGRGHRVHHPEPHGVRDQPGAGGVRPQAGGRCRFDEVGRPRAQLLRSPGGRRRARQRRRAAGRGSPGAVRAGRRAAARGPRGRCGAGRL